MGLKCGQAKLRVHAMMLQQRLITKFQLNPLTQSDFSQNAANLQQNAAFYSKLAIFEMCT